MHIAHFRGEMAERNPRLGMQTMEPPLVRPSRAHEGPAQAAPPSQLSQIHSRLLASLCTPLNSRLWSL
jgi:hypothetical protein